MNPWLLAIIVILAYILGRMREQIKHQYDHCPECGGHTKIEYGYDYRYDDKLICEDCSYVVATRWHL